MALALPSAQAEVTDPIVDAPTTDLVNTSPGTHYCKHLGTGMYDCAGFDGQCVTTWKDDDYDANYGDANATVDRHVCAGTMSLLRATA